MVKGLSVMIPVAPSREPSESSMAMSETLDNKYGFASVMDAVRRRSMNVLRMLLQDNEHLPILLDDEMKNEALSEAIINRDTEMARFIIMELGADAADPWAIGYAAEKGDVDMIRMLLRVPGVDSGANRNRAVQLACASGQIDALIALDSSPDVNVAASKNLALRLAAAGGHIKCVEYLLTRPNVLPSDSNGYAIKRSAARGHIEVVKRLLQIPAVYQDHATLDEAAIFASRHNHLEVLKQIVLHRGSVSVENGLSLRLACDEGHTEMVAYLLSVGKFSAEAMQESMSKAVQMGRLAVLNVLLERPDVDPAFSHNTLLVQAVTSANVEIVERLLSLPAVDPGDRRNLCVVIAAKSNYEEILGMLLRHPKVDCTDHEHTALIKAATNGHLSCLNMLLEFEVTPNCDSPWILTALNNAASNGRVDVVKRIIEIVPDVLKKEAMLASAQNGEVGVVNVLLDHVARAVDDLVPALHAAVENADHSILAKLLGIEELAAIFPTVLLQVCSTGNHACLKEYLATGFGVDRPILDVDLLYTALEQGFSKTACLIWDRRNRYIPASVQYRAFFSALRSGCPEFAARILQRHPRVGCVAAFDRETALHKSTFLKTLKICSEETTNAMLVALMVRRAPWPISGSARAVILQLAFWDAYPGRTFVDKCSSICAQLDKLPSMETVTVALPATGDCVLDIPADVTAAAPTVTTEPLQAGSEYAVDVAVGDP